MDKIGTPRSKKVNRDEQFKAHLRVVELESIIDQMADAMRSASLNYIAEHNVLDQIPRFTPNLLSAWIRFVTFARENAK